MRDRCHVRRCALASGATETRAKPPRGSAIAPTGVEHSFDVDAELARVFSDGVCPLHFEQALFEAMLDGWGRQQQSRMLCRETIVNRRRLAVGYRRTPGK